MVLNPVTVTWEPLLRQRPCPSWGAAVGLGPAVYSLHGYGEGYEGEVRES